VIGGLAVLAAFIWLWLAKRRKQRQLDDGDAASGGFGAPIRGGSGLSSPGMTSTPKTGELVQSRYPLGQVPPGWDAAKRRSHLMPVDPRLDPFAKGIYADQNRSRESFNSLQDNQDYSRRVHEPTRVLRATNPDPDD
jgi:cell wall integrity and stress response component